MALDTVNNNITVTKTRGVDVSAYNIITDYNKVKTDGCDLLLLK